MYQVIYFCSYRSTFLIYFFDLLFLSLKYVIISLLLWVEILELLTSFYFILIFVLNQLVLVVQMGIIYLFFNPFILHNLYKFTKVKTLFGVVKRY